MRRHLDAGRQRLVLDIVEIEKNRRQSPVRQQQWTHGVELMGEDPVGLPLEATLDGCHLRSPAQLIVGVKPGMETGEVEDAVPIDACRRGRPLIYAATLDVNARRHLPGFSDNALVVADLIGAEQHVRRRIEQEIKLVHHSADSFRKKPHPLIETVHRSSGIF